MFLITAATAYEMEAFSRHCPAGLVHDYLITGVGPVETALRLSLFLSAHAQHFAGVINFGSGGAYFQENGTPAAELLDICLAETEVLGDFGICYDQDVERISVHGLEVHDFFTLDPSLLSRAQEVLSQAGIPSCLGPFITVSCVSATRQRGEILRHTHHAICENMEGAAVARVCDHFHLPFLEMRCISNYVEDRDRQKWKLKEASAHCGKTLVKLLKGLSNG